MSLFWCLQKSWANPVSDEPLENQFEKSFDGESLGSDEDDNEVLNRRVLILDIQNFLLKQPTNLIKFLKS